MRTIPKRSTPPGGGNGAFRAAWRHLAALAVCAVAVAASISFAQDRVERVVEGVVRDADGNPVADVEVQIFAAPGRTVGHAVALEADDRMATVRTGSDGSFRSTVEIEEWSIPARNAERFVPPGTAAMADVDSVRSLVEPVATATASGMSPACAQDLRGAPLELVLRPAPEHEVLVRGPDDEPVPGARVWVHPRSHWTTLGPPVLTDDEGRARVRRPPDAAIVVAAVGLASERVEPPTDTPATDRVEVRLAEGRTIAGRATTEDGSPVARARVMLQAFEPNHLRESTLTDADGRFVFTGVGSDPDQAWRVWVPGWANGSAAPVTGVVTDVVPGIADLAVVCRPLHNVTFTGVVRNEDGRPVSGVTVMPGQVSTDGEGRYSMPASVAAGQYVWRAGTRRFGGGVQQFGHAVIEVRGPGPATGDMVLRPEPGVSYVSVGVTGKVGEDGEPVELYAWLDGGGVRQWGALGVDTIVGVTAPPGTPVRLTATYGERKRSGLVAEAFADAVTGPPDAIPEIDMELGRCGQLAFDLIGPDGDPVPFELDYARRRNPSPESGRGRWDRDYIPRRTKEGNRTLAADEERFVVLEVPGYAREALRIQPPHGSGLRRETVHLSRPHRAVGRLVGADGKPPEGKFVAYAHVEGRQGWNYAKLVVGSDGRFVIDGLPAGDCVLRVFAGDEAQDPSPGREHGRVGGSDPVVVRTVSTPLAGAGPGWDFGEVPVSAPRVLRGRVTNHAGRPLGGAVLSVFDAGGRQVAPSWTTRGDGTFAHPVPAATRLRLVVERRGAARADFTLDPDASESIDVELAAPGRVRVLQPLGAEPNSWWHVEARAPTDEHPWTPRLHTPARRVELVDGVQHVCIVIEDLPAGSLELTLGRRTRTFEVRAGETVDWIWAY